MGTTIAATTQLEKPASRLAVKAAKVLTVLIVVVWTVVYFEFTPGFPRDTTVASKSITGSSSTSRLAAIRTYNQDGSGGGNPNGMVKNATLGNNSSSPGKAADDSSHIAAGGTIGISGAAHQDQAGHGDKASHNLSRGRSGGAGSSSSSQGDSNDACGNGSSRTTVETGHAVQLNALWAGGGTMVQPSAAHNNPAGVSSAVAMFAFISRNNAKILPYSLNNIKRLALRFAKAHVVMVENDSTDDTVDVFNAWLQETKQKHPTIHGEARSYKWKTRGRDLSLFARARNDYLAALRELKYDDVNLLIAVDTDMCVPWDVNTMEDVISALMLPEQQQKPAALDAIYAYGACGWFTKPEKGSYTVPPYTPGSFARYCDLFALQDLSGKRYVIRRNKKYHDTVTAAWREPVVPLLHAAASPDVYCDSAQMTSQGCTVVNGEPVIPVRSAFGGLGVFQASLFRHHNSSVEASTARLLAANESRSDGPSSNSSASETSAAAALPCAYATDEQGDECEHVPFSNCLHERHYKQAIAMRLIVSWEKEGCAGPVFDELPGPTAMLGWGNITTRGGSCPCGRY